MGIIFQDRALDIGTIDMPLAQFRMTTDPALHTSVAIHGEATHTSLDFGRVVLESFHNRTHTVIYAGPADAYSYSGQLNTDLPLDRARLEWSSEHKFAYARKVFDDSAEQIFNTPGGLKKILDAEYPGGSELAHIELLKWLNSAPVRNQD